MVLKWNAWSFIYSWQIKPDRSCADVGFMDWQWQIVDDMVAWGRPTYNTHTDYDYLVRTVHRPLMFHFRFFFLSWICPLGDDAPQLSKPWTVDTTRANRIWFHHEVWHFQTVMLFKFPGVWRDSVSAISNWQTDWNTVLCVGVTKF